MPCPAGCGLLLRMHSPGNRSLRSPGYAACTDTRFRDFPNRRSVSRRITILNFNWPCGGGTCPACGDFVFTRLARRRGKPRLHTSTSELLLLFLLRRSLGSFTLSLLFALLNDLGLSRSSGSIRSNSFRSRNHFFLHRGHVCHWLVFFRDVLVLVALR